MSQIKRWKCEVCGYIHEGDNPPDSCPVCGAGKSSFTPFEAFVKKEKKPKISGKWSCSICGYESESIPGECPVCGAGKNLFKQLEPEPQKRATGDSGAIIIAGAGIAGFTAAEQARLTSGNASITLISREKNLPYYRLNLTRFLAQEVSEADLLLKPEKWYEENNIKIIYGNVKSIERENKKVSLEDGKGIPYDKLILANGSHPFIPPFKGADKNGVFSFRTINDAKKLIEASSTAKRCACVGGGLLGLETAGALKKRGIEITVLEGYGWLLPRQLTKSAGLKLKNYVESTGIRVLSGVKIKEIVGDETVGGIALESGQIIDVDMVTISTGIRSNSYLARQSGLKVQNGVIVDDSMRSSDSDIYAAGDIAEHAGRLYGIWPASYAQGAVAGINAAGGDTEFTGIAPSVRLKVLDVDVFSIGKVDCNDASYQIYEKDEGANYRFFLLRDGKIEGAVLYGDTSLAQVVKEAVEKKLQIADISELMEKIPELRNI